MSLWKKIFGEKSGRETFDPLRDLTLPKLKVGFLVDYELKTWQVKQRDSYDFDGDRNYEWKLDAGDDVCFLAQESESSNKWTISRPIAFSGLGQDVRDHVRTHEDPPPVIDYKGTQFSLTESGAGHYYQDDRDEGEELIYWDYVDATSKHILTIQQWGEDEFEASSGLYVSEYEFSNVLPGPAD